MLLPQKISSFALFFFGALCYNKISNKIYAEENHEPEYMF